MSDNLIVMSAAGTLPTAKQAPSVEAEPGPAPSGLRMRARRWAVPTVGIAVVTTLVSAAIVRWEWWVGLAAVQVTDDATVRAELTSLSARVAGNVVEVAVGDYQHVRAGDLLVVIDPADYEIEVAQRDAAVAGARAVLRNLDNQIALQRATISQAETQVVSAQAKALQAEQEHRRQKGLLESTFGTRQRFEQAVAELAIARAAELAAEAAVEAQKEQLNVLEGTRAQRHADLRAAEASAASAKLRLSHTRIVAPFDGVVGERKVQPGDYVTVGGSLISIVPLPRVYIVANYKETQLTHVEPGQMVDVTVDMFPDILLKGHVERLSPASGAQFALLPPDNATGNFTKVVQRLPLRIVLEPNQALVERLRPGMSVVTRIRTDPEQRR